MKTVKPTSPRFALRTLFWVFIAVSAFFGGRASMLETLRDSEVQLERARRRALAAEKRVGESDAQARMAMARVERLQWEINNGTAFPIRRIVGITSDGTLFVRPLFASEKDPVRLYGVVPDPAFAHPYITEFWLGKDASVTERGKDTWGRFMVDVAADGKRLSVELLRAGFAVYDIENVRDEELAQLENEARAARRGLWAHE